MATEFTHPFIRGANLYLTPRLMTAYEEWRRDACALETKRVERDLGALRLACEAIANAKDWGEFNSASQAVMSDYCKATTSLWQDGIEVAMRHQSALGEAFSDAMKSWHSTWTGGFEKAVPMNPTAMPPWFKNLTTPTALPLPATVQGDASSTQSGTRSRRGDHLAT
jgi:hypothetical protein